MKLIKNNWTARLLNAQNQTSETKYKIALAEAIELLVSAAYILRWSDDKDKEMIMSDLINKRLDALTQVLKS